MAGREDKQPGVFATLITVDVFLLSLTACSVDQKTPESCQWLLILHYLLVSKPLQNENALDQLEKFATEFLIAPCIDRESTCTAHHGQDRHGIRCEDVEC